MRKKAWKKSFVFGIIILFIGVGTIKPIGNAEAISDEANSSNATVLAGLRNIMLTGYWNPTGQMIAPFSNNAYLNPKGWKGGNWEDFGYNVYSFFPTPETYNGTFEVDYQNTWEDFWDITSQIRPIAIISFGAGDGPWEIEYNARNLDTWINDEEPPYQPTPSPPDDSVPPGYVRHPTLPIQAIADAVNSKTPIEAWIDWDDDPGSYLCEYIAYLGMWYQALHNTSNDPYPCRVAGFIHVNNRLALEDVMEATNLTLRETIEYLVHINNPPNAPTIMGPAEGKVHTEYEYTFVAADFDGDDVYYWVQWGEGCPTVEWIGPYTSGEEITLTYAWDSKGTYTIRAVAKDAHDAESEVGTLEVGMPKTHENPVMALIEELFDWLEQIFERGVLPGFFNP